MDHDGYLRNTRLKSVVDGDTVRVLIDLGFRVYREESIRLEGISAPHLWRVSQEEIGRARECRDYVVRWFERHETNCSKNKKWPFIIVSSNGEGFGRYMGRISCLKGHCLNDDILQTGLVKAYSKDE